MGDEKLAYEKKEAAKQAAEEKIRAEFEVLREAAKADREAFAQE